MYKEKVYYRTWADMSYNNICYAEYIYICRVNKCVKFYIVFGKLFRSYSNSVFEIMRPDSFISGNT